MNQTTAIRPVTLTAVDYNESTDELTIRFSDSRPDETISCDLIYNRWEAYVANDSLSAVDTALAKLYSRYYVDQPQDMLNHSYEL